MSTLSDYEVRREYVLEQAVRAGKFDDARRAHWRSEYDRNPVVVEQSIALMASGIAVAPPAVVSEQPYPRELFPELARAGQRRRASRGATAVAPTVAATAEPTRSLHVRPVRAATEGDISDDQVSAWSRELFPEAAARAGAAPGRISRAIDA